jgi:hypothetical protein
MNHNNKRFIDIVSEDIANFILHLQININRREKNKSMNQLSTHL